MKLIKLKCNSEFEQCGTTSYIEVNEEFLKTHTYYEKYESFTCPACDSLIFKFEIAEYGV